MIAVFATGFIPKKPELEYLGPRRTRKCTFAVVWERRARVAGDWVSVYERATFEAWDDEAERVASTLDRGFTVTCSGTQTSSDWTDGSGANRRTVRYKLTDWNILRRGPPDATGPSSSRHEDAGSVPSRRERSGDRAAPEGSTGGQGAARRREADGSGDGSMSM